MSGKPYSLYSVWANDKHDTLICIDRPAAECAALMGVKLNVFYQYASRPGTAWTIIKTRKDKKKHE